jgi:hypothetical protein
MLPSPDVFATPFFRAHRDRRVVEIPDHRGQPRAYNFPTFFTQTPAMMLMFTADFDAVAALLAARLDGSTFSRALRPVRVSHRRCLFAVACYRYGQISDGMVGYNEFALGVPVSNSRLPLVPALARRAWPSFGVHLIDMPVDSDENKNRGVRIWGLPKSIKTFRYEDSPDRRTVEVFDADERCLRLTVPRGGRRHLVSELARVYSIRDGQALRCNTYMEGACWQYTQLSPLAKQVELELGPRPAYAALSELQLSARPVLVRDFECLSTALYAPDPA